MMIVYPLNQGTASLCLVDSVDWTTMRESASPRGSPRFQSDRRFFSMSTFLKWPKPPVYPARSINRSRIEGLPNPLFLVLLIRLFSRHCLSLCSSAPPRSGKGFWGWSLHLPAFGHWALSRQSRRFFSASFCNLTTIWGCFKATFSFSPMSSSRL